MEPEKIYKIEKKLRNSSIGIAGAGGLGSNAAIALARSGIGKLVIVDFDKIEDSNLNRQYYFRDQIGQNKVDTLKTIIKNINLEIIVETHTQKLREGEMEKPFTNVDIIIEALDKAETKTKFIEEISQKLPNKKIISASGVAGIGNSDRIKTHKSGNLYIVYDENAKDVNDDILLSPKVGLMANWQANIALEILLEDIL